MKKRKIPHVPPEERVRFDVGHHNVPVWLSAIFIVVIFLMIIAGKIGRWLAWI